MFAENRAIYTVVVDGVDITSRMVAVVARILVRDAAGAGADTAQIDLDDTEAQIALPRAGASIVIALGWFGGAAIVVFEGVVDEVTSNGGRGQGRMLSVSAKSADTRGKPKERQSRHKDDATLDDAAQEFGAAAGVTVSVHPDLASITRNWWAMQNESFLAWGARIAREVGATFKVVGTRAVMVPRNAGVSASGKPLATIRAVWGDNLINWNLSPVLSRPDYQEFRVEWFDRDEAKWKQETVQARPTNGDAPAVAAAETDGPPVADSGAAKNRAGSKAREGERARGGGSVQIVGAPEAQAEAACEVVGTRPGIDGTYRIESVQHEYQRSGGYVTTLELKEPAGAAGSDDRAATSGSGTPSDTAGPATIQEAGENLSADNLA